MKKISRKLLMSIFSMAFAIIALGTTTFAWFTMNSTATAEIEVGVQSGTEGILLSTDCKEFTGAITIHKSNFQLKPATYVMDGASLAAADKFTLIDGTTDASANVLSFDIYMLTEAKVNVKFNSTGNDVTNETTGGIGAYTFLKTVSASDNGLLTANKTVKVDAVNALRSVVDVYSTGYAKLQCISAANSAEGIAGSLAEFGSAKKKKKLVGFNAPETATVLTGNESNGVEVNFGQSLAMTNAANAYVNAINPTTFTGNTVNTNYSALTVTNGYNVCSSTTLLTTTQTSVVTRTTFYFWLEGYDADCFDAILGQKIRINLSFTAEAVTE